MNRMCHPLCGNFCLPWKNFSTVRWKDSIEIQVWNATGQSTRFIWMHRSETGSRARHLQTMGKINFRSLTEACPLRLGIFPESLAYLRCCRNILTATMSRGKNWRWTAVSEILKPCLSGKTESRSHRNQRRSFTGFLPREFRQCRSWEPYIFPRRSNRCG